MVGVRSVYGRLYGASQVAFVVAAVESYRLLRGELRPDWPLAIRHARDVESLERVAHLAWEAPVQHVFLRAPDLVRALNLFYVSGHFVLTGLFFLWLYRRSPAGFRRFRDAFLVATALALVVHWRFPTAPPRDAGLGIEDTLRRLSGIDIGSPGSGSFTDPVAAMPSLHAGWAAGVGAGLVRYGRRPAVRVAGALYPAVVVATILVTGNHFVLDAASGIAVVGLGFALVELASRAGAVLQSPPRRGVEQPGSSPGS